MKRRMEVVMVSEILVTIFVNKKKFSFDFLYLTIYHININISILTTTFIEFLPNFYECGDDVIKCLLCFNLLTFK